jgi:hypothetical protein
MKCIKAIKPSKGVEVGDIKRVDDKTAYNMVGSMWAYIPKSEWKAQFAKQKSTEQASEENKKEKKSNPKQMDGVKSDEPFVKTRKKSK